MIIPRFPLEDSELKQLMKDARSKCLETLNSMTIANSPPEKLVEMREAFDEKMDQVWDIIH